MEAPVGAVPTRFAVDAVLGRLARWLRVLGHDTAWGPQLRGRALMARARRDGRLLLTRDTRLVRRRDCPPHLLVVHDRFRDQLRQLGAAGVLGGAELFGRCLACNRSLERVVPEAVTDRVPSYVAATQQVFWRCARCRRIFWPATHHARMRAELAALGLVAEGGRA